MEEVEGDQPGHNIIIMTLQLKVKGQGSGLSETTTSPVNAFILKGNSNRK